MCVPVIARDQIVGIITIVHPIPNFFTQEHLTLLGAISDQAGIAIYNARLHGELQATRHRYQELFEDSIDPICITGWNGIILEANRQAALLSGRLDQSLRGNPNGRFARIEPDWLIAQEIDLQTKQDGADRSPDCTLYPD